MDMITKGFVASYLIFAGILGVGVVFFHDSEAGMQANTAAAIVVGAVMLRLFDTLEGRGGRRNR